MSSNPKPPEAMIISYMTMRKIIGWLGISLIPVVVLGGLIIDYPRGVRGSVSAYYHSGMRDELVGIICGIALFLFSYHGYDKRDSLVSKLAGLFALGVAWFPTSATNDKTDIVSILHYVTSGIFFALLSYMSIALFTKSSGNITEQKKKRNRVYRTCGIIMLVSVACIPLSRINVIDQQIAFLKPTLIFESAALVSFGISWLTKGEFLLKDE